jgi:hypothetical protein
METLIINTKTSNELKLIQDFLKKNKLESRILSVEDKEDIVLLKMMEETDYDDIVPTEEFLKELRGK